MNTPIKLEPSWKQRLSHEFEQEYMLSLRHFLKDELDAGKVIYPPAENWFSALNTTTFEQVKVVILGQDPYHGPQQAHGLCFSVQPEVAIPPSLRNIYKELVDDLGITAPEHGCLLSWARQGVLLLNSVLTVESGQAGSHQGKGWEMFTDKIIQRISDEKEHVVFMLWGGYAHKKGKVIDADKHLVLKQVHPSPLSAYRGFLGCKHFSQANSYLEKHGSKSIDWSVPNKDEAMHQLQAE
ncbi:MAG: uracil-DNA glycosylase [Ghiorsea sp.]